MARVDLQLLLFAMGEINIELHIYKNPSHAITLIDENGNVTYQGCEEVEVVKGTTSEVLHFVRERCHKDINWYTLEAFSIGYLKKRSRTIRINAEIVGE